jgi:hypothetical protein
MYKGILKSVVIHGSFNTFLICIKTGRLKESLRSQGFGGSFNSPLQPHQVTG